MTTLCDYCNKLAANTCTLCGKRVCEDHFDAATGMCTGHNLGKKPEMGAKKGPKARK